MKVYKPQEFAKMLGVSVSTLQRWDREDVLKSRRTPTGRRFYTDEEYNKFMDDSKPSPAE